MKTRPSLQDFVDDELLRAPLAFDTVVDAVLEQWRRASPASSRWDADEVRALHNHRREVVRDAMLGLRAQVSAEITGTPAPRRAAPATAAPARLELSLIGDDEISADIEVSRAVERIKSAAEFELRELQAYTSALVDDVNVARDTNPFRPEAYVRALWSGVQGVSMPRARQAAFMRDAAEPMAKALRQGYAAACSRLEGQGIEPAAHRTIVLSVTSRGGTLYPAQASESLEEIRDSLPMPLDEPVPARATARPPTLSPSEAAIDQRLIELLSRLFDAIQSDTRLSPSTVSLLLRLQPSALRVALRDTGMLQAYDHPVWRFMDVLAFVIDSVPASAAERCLSHCRQLIDHLVADGNADAARFDWATGRLMAFDRHLLEQSIAAARPDIERLRSTADGGDPPIDVGNLDTVPAELMSDEPLPTPSAPDLHPGHRVRIYLHGDWRLLQVLWVDPVADLWLLRDTSTDQPWALRRSALERLAAERLALPWRPRSLVRVAAGQVARAIPPAR
ncbi:DUF1631 family protein [Ideonella sp. A 288]|uniref:DUF1631 family protein n=1 Tax=Ideonella sp. A 288 TaxID=1962181 RepID=UPI000B4ABE75|nr:DUF1631 family protein [Ideonella sp. A 288]